MDSKSLGGPDHETPLYRSPLVSNKNVNFQTEGTWGSFASWESPDGTRWVLAPIGGPVAVDFPVSYGPTPNGGVIALKLKDTAWKNGAGSGLALARHDDRRASCGRQWCRLCTRGG